MFAVCDIGLIELNSRLGLLHDEDLILRLLRLNCLLLFQLLVAGQIHLPLCEHGLVVLQLRFGLIELRLIDVAFDTEELRSLRDRGAILIIDRFQIALDARDQSHRPKRCGVAGEVEIHSHRLLDGLRDNNFRRRRREIGVFRAAAHESQRRQNRQARTSAFSG